MLSKHAPSETWVTSSSSMRTMRRRRCQHVGFVATDLSDSSLIPFFTAFSDQSDLIKAWNTQEQPSHINHLRIKLREKAKAVLDEVFSREGVNILVAPADSAFPIYSSASGKRAYFLYYMVHLILSDVLTMPGYPVATVPLGQLKYNGRPFGLCLVGREGSEETLLQFMTAFEASFPKRAVPSL
jgi:amidase